MERKDRGSREKESVEDVLENILEWYCDDWRSIFMKEKKEEIVEVAPSRIILKKK